MGLPERVEFGLKGRSVLLPNQTLFCGSEPRMTRKDTDKIFNGIFREFPCVLWRLYDNRSFAVKQGRDGNVRQLAFGRLIPYSHSDDVSFDARQFLNSVCCFEEVALTDFVRCQDQRHGIIGIVIVAFVLDQ